MKRYTSFLLAAVLVTGVMGCSKMDKIGILNNGGYTDTAATLKGSSSANIGVAVDYAPMTGDAKYAATVKNEFRGVTFSYQLKHGAIVQNNGTYNYTQADALVNACAGLTIYGHTLGWHQNQNATFLKAYAGITLPAAVNLLQNGDFESGSGNSFTNWSAYNGGTAFVAGSGSNEVHGGSRSLKVINPGDNPGAQYKVQLASDLFSTKSGTQYVVSFWIKAAAAGGSMRLSTQSPAGAAQYQGDQTIGASWSQITWTFTANDVQTRILFDMGLKADTYYVDDATVNEVVVAPSGAQVANKVDSALYQFINTTVTRYKGTIKAWDVINELLADDGSIRNNTNTPAPSGSTDYFVWSNYLGRDYPVKAFTYAHNADPDALLFINDYALETNNTKLDSLIALVNELKSKNVKVDGIGTQMHVSWNTSYAGIDNMMKKLAATGLLIRISELDVKINPVPKTGFILTPTEAAYQADMYKYIVQSYLKTIPPAQQYGITIWGLTDNTSWLYNNGQDYPLLFNAAYAKKAAYAGVLQALRLK